MQIFDFVPEPGGTENISIKQIMLGEQTQKLWFTTLSKERKKERERCFYSGYIDFVSRYPLASKINKVR